MTCTRNQLFLSSSNPLLQITEMIAVFIGFGFINELQNVKRHVIIMPLNHESTIHKCDANLDSALYSVANFVVTL